MTEARVMDRKVYPENALLFREGSRGDVAYLVQKGEVEILKTLPDGSEKLIGVIKEGGIFGEMALIDDKPRMASARTTEPTTVVIINQLIFQERLSKLDPFMRGLLSVLVQNIRNMANSSLT